MFKKFFVLLTLILIPFSLSSCESFLNKIGVYTITINTQEDFENQITNSNANKIVLNTDIDGKGKEWPGCYADEFVGNGHVIKNFTSTKPLFGKSTDKISDVIFEKISVVCEGERCAVVSNGENATIESVIVRDCVLEAISDVPRLESFATGIIAAGGRYPTPLEQEKSSLLLDNPTILNCGVENSKLLISNTNPLYIDYKTAYIGLLAGISSDTRNSYVIDSDISVTTKGIYSDVYFGNLLGCSTGLVELSYTKNNNLEYFCNYYYENFLGYSTAKVNYIGGLVGYAYLANINNCYTQENIIMTESVGALQVGGMVGRLASSTISQSYDSDSNITLKGKVLTEIERYGGQLVGYTNNSSISNSFAYNKDSIADEGTLETNLCYTCGFSGGISDTSNINFCASYSNDIRAKNTDSFSPKCETILNCYVTKNGDTPNINELPLIETGQWLGDYLIDLIMLTSPNWSSGTYHPILNM